VFCFVSYVEQLSDRLSERDAMNFVVHDLLVRCYINADQGREMGRGTLRHEKRSKGLYFGIYPSLVSFLL
jgi:hypothetical protein